MGVPIQLVDLDVPFAWELPDPEQGGDIVFPEQRLRVAARAGCAVLFQNGTLHAAGEDG